MALSTFVGDFAVTTSVEQQSITGVGFTPKVVIFFISTNTSNGAVAHMRMGIGFAISSTERACIFTGDRNAEAETDGTARYSTDTAFRIQNPGASTIKVAADLETMDADGFTIDVTVVDAAYKIGFLALGGSDLTNVKTTTFDAPTSTGNFSITGVGYQPDAVMFISNSHTSEVDRNGALGMIGFALSSTKRGYLTIATKKDVTTSDTSRHQTTGKCAVRTGLSGSVEGEADFVSMDADGFTIDVTDAWPSADKVIYLALKGGQYDFGTITSQTGTGNFSTTGVGFQPNALMLTSFLNPTAAGEQSQAKFSLGLATSSTQRWVTGGTSEDNQATSDADSFADDTKIYQDYNFSRTVIGAIDFVSFDNDGYTLDQTDADASGNEILYMAFGSNVVPPSSVGIFQLWNKRRHRKGGLLNG